MDWRPVQCRVGNHGALCGQCYAHFFAVSPGPRILPIDTPASCIGERKMVHTHTSIFCIQKYNGF